MNKLLVILSIALVFGAVLLTHAQDEEPEAAAEEAAEPEAAAEEAAGEPEGESKVNLNGYEITMEPVNSASRPNLVSGAVRGTGSLLRNYTMETAQLAKTLGKSVGAFTKNTAYATGRTIVRAAQRISDPIRRAVAPKDPNTVTVTV